MGEDVAGDVRDIDRAVHLSGGHVVAILVDAAHVIQDIEHIRDLAGLFQFPPESKQPNTGTGSQGFQDCLGVHRAAHVLKPQGRDAGKGRTGEIRQGILVADDERGDSGRQMQHSEHTAVGQRHTGDLGAIEIHLFNARATGQIHGFLVAGSKAGAVADIQLLQQLVLAQIQRLEVSVGVILGGVAQDELLQLGGIDELGIAHPERRKIAHIGKLRCGINIDFRIVHIVEGALHDVGFVSLCSGLHQIGTIFHCGIHVSVWRDRDIRLGIATQGDDIGQRVTGIVLGVDIPEAVIQPPLSLLCLGAKKHRKISRRALLLQWSQVLEPGILIEDGFRPLGLMLLKCLLDLVIGDHPGGAKSLIHGPQLFREHLPQVLPEYGLLTVVDVSTTRRTVDVLQIVGEHKGAFVVDPNRGIHVVGQKYDLLIHLHPPY